MVVRYQGAVLTVEALLRAAHSDPAPAADVAVPLRHTAAGNADSCRALIARDEGVDVWWRFGILQTLDDYDSVLRRGGVSLAAEVFAEEPPRTGSGQIDAAFAALAAHLAARDGWTAPAWAHDPSRCTTACYPGVPVIFRADADRESPNAFRQRGIFITSRSLLRA